MPTPLIGITTRFYQDEEGLPLIASVESYVQAVLRAGGTPVLIPIGVPDDRLAELHERLDGILFTGGADIDPSVFGGDHHPRVYGVNPRRDALELSLARQVLQSQTPFLGICRGFQVINVALGGTLYTHLPEQHPSAIKHNNSVRDSTNRLVHSVRIEAGTCLAKIVDTDEIQVNSLHHQGAKAVAPGLVVSARSEDGLVEGLELSGHPFGVAVQWHPEWLPDDEPSQAIFTAFIAAANSRLNRVDTPKAG